MGELPLRFGVHPSFALSNIGTERRGVTSLEPLTAQKLQTTYYDTEGLRLARFGVTLRHEDRDNTSNWLVKVPHVDEDVVVDGDPGMVPVRARELVTAFARAAEIEAAGTLRTHRRTWALCKSNGRAIAELADVEVSLIREGRVAARFRELELHSCGRAPRRLEDIAEALRRAGAVDAEPIPTKTRVLGPWAEAQPDVPEPSHIEPPVSAEVAIQAALVSGARRIMLNDPGTRLGDAEALHQMRVGARRLRSDLGTFGDLVGRDWAEALVTELRWLGICLGSVRDLDVLSRRLAKDAKKIGVEAALTPLFDEIEGKKEEERARLLETLAGSRYVTLLDSLVAAAVAPATTKKAAAPARRQLPKLLLRRYKKLFESVATLDGSASNEAWHKSRIRAKRARYAAEAVAPALGKEGKAATAFAKRAAKLQDVLGTLQDSNTPMAMLRDCAERHEFDGGLNLAAGRLIERESHAAGQARAKFQELWGKLDLEKHIRRLR